MPSEGFLTPVSPEIIKNQLEHFSDYWQSRLSQIVDEGSANGTEMRYGKQFCLDFLECLGIQGTRAVEFEATAIRFSTGSPGRVDALIPGAFIAEIKSINVDVDSGYYQLRDYLMGDTFNPDSYPSLAIVSNFSQFIVWSPRHSWDPLTSENIFLVDLESISDFAEYFHGALSNIPPIEPSDYEVESYSETSSPPQKEYTSADPSPIKIIFLLAFLVLLVAASCS